MTRLGQARRIVRSDPVCRGHAVSSNDGYETVANRPRTRERTRETASGLGLRAVTRCSRTVRSGPGQSSNKGYKTVTNHPQGGGA